MITVREMKKFLEQANDNDTIVINDGISNGYITPCDMMMYHRTIPRLGEEKRDSVVINMEGRVFNAQY